MSKQTSSRYIIHAPHSASKEIFSCNGYFRDVDRPIDILLTGMINPITYPFRTRLFNLLNEPAVQSAYRIHTHHHPGYGLTYSNAQVQLEEYATLLKRTKIHLVTTSAYKLAPAKLAETQLSGALIVGDIPDSRQKYYENLIVSISMEDDDESILRTLKWWIEHPKERLAKARGAYIYGVSGETWTSWVNSMLMTLGEYQRKQLEHDNNNNLDNPGVFLVSTMDQFGYQILENDVYNKYNSMILPLGVPFHNQLFTFKEINDDGLKLVHTCGCQPASYIDVEFLFHYSSNRFDVLHNLCDNDKMERRMKLNLMQHGNLLSGLSFVKVQKHYFFCDQSPLHIDHVNIDNILRVDEIDIALNMFPNAYKILHDYVFDNEQNAKEESSQVSVFVSITSIDPLRIWMFSKATVFDRKINSSVIIDFQTENTETSRWRKAIFKKIRSLSFNLLRMKNKCASKCYQILEINMTVIELNGNINVDIQSLDVSPKLSGGSPNNIAGQDLFLLRKYLLTNLYDLTWKMKRLHPQLFYPSPLDFKLWLNNNYYCNKIIDCDNDLIVTLLLQMLTEVYYGHYGSFQLVWPIDLHSNIDEININDYAKFSEKDLELYNTMFFIINDQKKKENLESDQSVHKLFRQGGI